MLHSFFIIFQDQIISTFSFIFLTLISHFQNFSFQAYRKFQNFWSANFTTFFPVKKTFIQINSRNKKFLKLLKNHWIFSELPKFFSYHPGFFISNSSNIPQYPSGSVFSALSFFWVGSWFLLEKSLHKRVVKPSVTGPKLINELQKPSLSN